MTQYHAVTSAVDPVCLYAKCSLVAGETNHRKFCITSDIGLIDFIKAYKFYF